MLYGHICLTGVGFPFVRLRYGKVYKVPFARVMFPGAYDGADGVFRLGYLSLVCGCEVVLASYVGGSALFHEEVNSSLMIRAPRSSSTWALHSFRCFRDH